MVAEYPALSKLLDRIKAVAAQINSSGWAEANAGNISVNVTTELQDWAAPGLQLYLVSRTGSRYRDLACDPFANLVLALVDGAGWKTVPPDCRPTSEWLCHLMLQQRFLASITEDKVVLHAHPNSVILLSQTDICSDLETLNSSLNQALPEFELFLPDGVAIAPHYPPGSQALAECSLVVIGARKALIWQGHGLICAGPSPDAALDLMQVVDKAASILLGKMMLASHLPAGLQLISPGR